MSEPVYMGVLSQRNDPGLKRSFSYDNDPRHGMAHPRFPCVWIPDLSAICGGAIATFTDKSYFLDCFSIPPPGPPGAYAYARREAINARLQEPKTANAYRGGIT